MLPPTPPSAVTHPPTRHGYQTLREDAFLPWVPGTGGLPFLLVAWPPQWVDGLLAVILLLSSAVCTTLYRKDHGHSH